MSIVTQMSLFMFCRDKNKYVLQHALKIAKHPGKLFSGRHSTIHKNKIMPDIKLKL